jgi:serine/threonine protein kinase
MPYRGRSTLVDLIDLAYENGLPQSGHLVLAAARRWSGPADQSAEIKSRQTSERLWSLTYVDRVIELAIQLADALDHAHGYGIIHGDLKPSNVLLTSDGVPLLLDFNLSRDAEESFGLRGGTLPYMPPEYLERIANSGVTSDVFSIGVDPKADIYSFGALLFELLTGQPPVNCSLPSSNAAATAKELLDKLETTEPSIRASNPIVPKGLEEIILRCMRFRPSDRFASMQQIVHALRRESKLIPTFRRIVRSRPRFYFTIAAIILTTIAVLIGYLATRPPRFERAYWQGLQLLSAGDSNSAADRFREALDGNESFRPARFALGRALIYSNELDAAIEEFGQLAENPGDPRSMAYLAYCFSLSGSIAPAVYWNREALENGEKSAAVYNNLGASYLAAPNRLPKAQRLSDPESCLHAAHRLDPDSRIVPLNLIQLEIAKVTQDASYNPINALPIAEFAMLEYRNDPRVLDIVRQWYSAVVARAVTESSSDHSEIELRLRHINDWITAAIGAQRNHTDSGKADTAASLPLMGPGDGVPVLRLFYMEPL